MSDDKIYFYNNTYYSESDLQNMDRRKRYDIKHRQKRLELSHNYYERNADRKKLYTKQYREFKKESNRLLAIEI
jgi:hypothetical protein